LEVSEASSIGPKKEKQTKSIKPIAKSRRRGRGTEKVFPTLTLEQTLELANGIQNNAGTQKIRRLTLFDTLKKSPTSGPSRMLVTASSKYGLIEGNYNAEHLQLTGDGNIITNPESNRATVIKAKFKVGIEGIPIFKQLYDNLVGNKLPTREVLCDMVGDLGVPKDDQQNCVDIFIINAKYIGVVKVLSGAERIIPVDQLIEELPFQDKRPEKSFIAGTDTRKAVEVDGEKVDFSKICFFIAPIGEEGSEDRQHSDMILASFIERAVDGMGLHVVRADKITQPGLITAQVIQYILKSKVVIADLSFHNPNVFYELAIRHMTGLPAVHIVRRGDKLPFDLKDFRTITINTDDKYHLVASLDSYRSDIANFVRQALEGVDDRSNPILAHNPTLRVIVE
jgi:hypothetical protein